MVVHDNGLLACFYRSVIYLTDADPPHIFVIVNGAYEYLCICFGVAFRRRDIVDNGVKEGFHVSALFGYVSFSDPVSGRGKEKGTVKLFLIGIQINKEFQDLIYHFPGSCLRAVDLIDAYHHRKGELQRLLQNKFRLRHGALKGVNHQDNAVDHFQYALHLAAEIGMARCVYNIDFRILICDGGVLG